jgi:hypothetical protein
MLSIHKPNLQFQQHFPSGIEASDLHCVEFFREDDLISHLLLQTNAGIAIDAEQISNMR